MKLEDLLKDKDFLMSTNVELALMRLLENSGLDKSDIVLGRYDKEIGKAKEKIYKQFYERLEGLL